MQSDDAVLAVVDELARRLTPAECHELVESLPEPLHARLCSCETHRGRERVHRIDRAIMVARIAHRLGTTPAGAEAIAIDVLFALRHELPPLVVAHVAAQLPRDIRDVWLAAEPVAMPRDALARGARARVERDVSVHASLPDGVCAIAAFTEVMGALLERLSGGEALHVLIGLPEELRPLLEGPAVDRFEPPRTFGRDELFAIVAERLEISRDDATRIVPAVLAAAKHVLPQKEIDGVASQLPRDLRSLWKNAV